MRKTVLFLVLPILFLISCSSDIETSTASTLSNAAGESGATTTESDSIITTTSTMPEISPELKELIDKGIAVNSIKYIEGMSKDVLHIKGNKVKRELFEKRGLSDDDRYDEVYLDASDKKAYAVCESQICSSLVKKKFWEVDYDEFKPKDTPLDTLNSIVSGSIDKKRSKQIGSVPAYLVTFENNEGNTGELWISLYYGIPYEVNVNSITIIFEDIAVNNVKDEDVIIIPVGYTEK
ncbi:MAG: hypothetical protein V1740_00170 [Candidatus Woesearchaeota archaeon]